MAIDDAFHKLDAEGLVDLVQIWAYHDDVVLMVPKDAWLQTYKIFEQSFSDRGLHFAAHKNTTMVPMPFDTPQARQQFEEQLEGHSTLTQSLQILGSAEEGSFAIVLYAEVRETGLKIATAPPKTPIHA